MDKFCACVCSAAIILLILVVVCDLTRQRCGKCDKCKGVNKMERLTRPTVEVDETAAKYMGSFPVDIRTYKDRLLELILNGPTLNGVSKDALRQIIRQLYGALQAYEDIGLEPQEIEQTLMNFSSFLMEMTGGRMSKTNYTVQAMVSEANDHFERICDECRAAMDKEKEPEG